MINILKEIELYPELAKAFGSLTDEQKSKFLTEGITNIAVIANTRSDIKYHNFLFITIALLYSLL